MERFSLLATSLVASTLSVSASAQTAFLGNEIQLTDGGEQVLLFNSPSVGGTPGSPFLFGDLHYKGVPENRFKTTTGMAQLISIEDVFLGDVDWPGGPPDFYDIGIDSSSATTGLGYDNLCPDFFTTGTVKALLSIGPSGLPHPCVISPTTTCSGPAACPPLVTGYMVDIQLTSPIPITAQATKLRGKHLISFLPGGMTFGASSLVGACGNGDYVFQGLQSTTEEQADLMNVAGTSWCEGFHLGDPSGVSPSGPIKEPRTHMGVMNFGLVENVIEAVVADSSVPYGPVRGGASLAIDTSTASASVAAHVTANPSLVPAAVFPAASLGLPAVPAVLPGGVLCLVPDPTFNTTLAAWSGTGSLVGVDENGDGVFDQGEAVSVPLLIPPTIGGVRVYMQAFIITSFIPVRWVETTVWTIDLR